MADSLTNEELLARFKELPGRYVNKVVEIAFMRDEWFGRTDANVTEALGFETGSCISSALPVFVWVGMGEFSFRVFATGDQAESILNEIPVGAEVRAIATTVWGVRCTIRVPDVVEHEEILGLLLSEIVSILVPPAP